MHNSHFLYFINIFATKQREQLRKETTESGLLFVVKLVDAKFFGAVKNCNIKPEKILKLLELK